MQADTQERRTSGEGVHTSHPLRFPLGLWPILWNSGGDTEGMGFINPRVDPPRDEDAYYPDDEAHSLEHHCVVLTPDQWMCEDCGVSFDRDSSLGDYPETAIIEGGVSCVAYVPDGNGGERELTPQEKKENSCQS